MMGQPAAKQDDKITGSCTHTVNVPSASGTTPIPTVFPFNGTLSLSSALSANVRIMGRWAATEGSTANNTPPHTPANGAFATPPNNQATIKKGSGTVRINGKAAARAEDTAETCDESKPPAPGTVVATGTVRIGG